ncbi:hypothetical protein [Sulfitobacter geojensis]|uniref:Uncharacterized protein n=1 Tax=Sulfitobacter geojensis TaxID=1342299 RepID=A0AAE3B7B5_9RHOB|nr:hypothetical protein [Sulfitobacter geojensis]MBM1690781.1 hypothetical protein [Sulfitobacter geojensis]MBM1694847.1 hypothetical protein [Sulfitobacter geojensis]MBM1706999.1 hypothetical protein [Sulfitobacter geojensis]MBM1711057.1 hypothetical protein [Sulfitobacter geojensis]MBM1715123.1 hypothetical protein [Sulfitobacter geojensis]
MDKVFALALTALFFGSSVTVLSAKDCDAILAAGLSDTYSFSDNSSFDRAIHSSICSDRSTRRSGSNTVGLSIPIPKVAGMLGFNASDSRKYNRVDKYCSSYNDDFNRQAAISWTKSVVRPEVVRAWESCDTDKGFKCEATNLSNRDFTVEISWSRTNIGVGTEQAILNSSPALSNAVCTDRALSGGLKIVDDSSATFVCSYQDTSKNAYVILNSTQGPATCLAPARKNSPTPREYLNSCLNGSEPACLGILQDAGQAFSRCEELLQDEDADFKFIRFCANLQTGFRATEATADNLTRKCYSSAANARECQQAKQFLQQTASSTIDDIEEILNE